MKEFGFELGISPGIGLPDSDPVLSKIRVPKFIFPGQYHVLSNNKYFGSLKGLLGTAERQANVEGFDLLVRALGSNLAESIRFEAKDQDEFGTVEVVDAARKLMRGESNVGVLVLRKCNLYWGTGQLNITNSNMLQESLKLIPKLGRVYLISSSAAVETLTIHKKAKATGRLILLLVPESSLRETRKDK
jgi:hypothetical protein